MLKTRFVTLNANISIQHIFTLIPTLYGLILYIANQFYLNSVILEYSYNSFWGNAHRAIIFKQARSDFACDCLVTDTKIIPMIKFLLSIFTKGIFARHPRAAITVLFKFELFLHAIFLSVRNVNFILLGWIKKLLIHQSSAIS